ncbi:MAG: hypothetical protein ACXWUG_31540 [Polyangiales bacterium]
MRILFNDLPQSVRERFVRLTKTGTSDPIVVMYGPGGGSKGVMNWLGLIAGGVVAGYLLQWLPGTHFAPTEYGGAYLALAISVAITIGCLVGIVYRFIWKAPPYREGVYAFPGQLVRTEGEWLIINPTSDMGQPNVVHTLVNGGYRGSRVELSNRNYVYTYGSKDTAIAAADRIVAARHAYAQAWASGNPNALGPLDPFFECTTTNNWSQPTREEPRVPIVPTAAKIVRWLVALAIGAGTMLTLYSIKQDEYEENVKKYKKHGDDQPKKKKVVEDD